METLNNEKIQQLADDYAKDILADQYSDYQLRIEVKEAFLKGVNLAIDISKHTDVVAGFKIAIERLENPNYEEDRRKEMAAHFKKWERERAVKLLAETT